VELLVRSYQNLSKENKELIEEKKILLSKINHLKKEISDLERTLEKLRVSSSLDGGGQDAILARKKINFFLREIDKCIELLSN
tara:strand:- start:216 stop:464 length:249 start_codon:yes stop_codon:yes gene_type:complete